MMRTSFALLLLFSLSLQAQEVKVIVPPQSVVVGTAFQVQYIVTNPSDYVGSSQPQFDSCRIVSGPHLYKGNAVVNGKLQPIQNIAYTLVPLKTGTIDIGSITVSFRHLPEKESSEAQIKVLPQPKASFKSRSSYTDASLYASANKEDKRAIIDANIFVKAKVDKRSCYEGEPIVATFVLYSRLQSSSEAYKSPSFYGFSVVDVLNTNESHIAVETVNGKVYNTSVLRKVQLYPVQSGRLVIDPMYVHNEIEFEDTIRQLITKVDKEIATEPVTIQVKPLPANKPDGFSGAVGHFSIDTQIEKTNLGSNEQGKLWLTISGAGNFLQFGQPTLKWPENIDGYEPSVVSRLNKDVVPVAGKKTYEYAFAASDTGSYTLPSITFSFFNAASGAFETMRSKPIQFKVHAADTHAQIAAVVQKNSSNWVGYLIAGGVVFLVGFYFVFGKRKSQTSPKVDPIVEPGCLEKLYALKASGISEKQACLETERILKSFLNVNDGKLTVRSQKEIETLMRKCEMLLYAPLPSAEEKGNIINEAIALLEG
jgi:hypothetical protein